MRVFKYLNLPPIRICWEIFKGHSVCKEDFWTSQVWVFLKHDNLLTPIKCQADDGVIIVDINIPNLGEGAYSLKAIWVKNGLASYDVPTLLEQGKRCVSEVSDVFYVSRDSDKISTDGLINLRSDVASYGYDGLSAYEKCYLLGKTSLTEEEWLDALNSGAGWQPNSEQLYAMNSGITADKVAVLDELAELGIKMDTNKDVLTIGGIKYKMTRYKEEIARVYATPSVSLAYADVSAGTTIQMPTSNGISQNVTVKYDDGTEEVKAADVSGAVVTYKSSDESLATVDGSGRITWTSVNGSTTTEKKVTITKTVAINGKTNTVEASAKQLKAAQKNYVFYGSSVGEPTGIGSSSKELANGSIVEISTVSDEHKYCHFVAYKTDLNATIAEWKDADGDNLLDIVKTKSINEYTVKYILSENAYIENTSKVKITL